MFFRLFLLFTLGPLVEIYLLIKIGAVIGAFNTIALILITGIIGAFLAQSQGISVLFNIQKATQQGRMPLEEMIDGAFVLMGGFALITPGLVTDAFGFLCLIPVTRQFFKRLLRKYLEREVKRSNVRIHIDMRDQF
jgi:UPF0716 protein FxsA